LQTAGNRARTRRRNVSRRTIAGIVAGLTVFGAVFASAASLGGITSGNVGADNAAVTSCDTDGVTTAYTTAWDGTDDRYEVTSVTVSGIANACDGKTLSVSLTDVSSNQIGSGTVTVPTDALAFTASVTLSPAASAELTTGVHAAIA
jgi:hypothetical protein